MTARRREASRWDGFLRIAWVLVPAWFTIISCIRLSSLLPTAPGYDGMLYREATLRWLAGGDPWALRAGDAVFGAPPPTLVAMLPFAAMPEPVARIALIALGILASVWLIRRLQLPIWWLAFPPLVDGVYIANPHVFVVPLLILGAAPVAVVLKAYAAPVLLLQQRWRPLALAAGLALLTAPLVPWALFIERWPQVNAALASQSGGGGLSALATPILIPFALAAALALGRTRLAWWAVPAFWPYTQWYYSSMVLPAVSPLAAVALAVPVQGATTVAIVLAAIEVWWKRRAAPTPATTTPADDPTRPVASAIDSSDPVLSSTQ